LRGEKAAGCVGVWQHSTRAREDETRETPKSGAHRDGISARFCSVVPNQDENGCRFLTVSAKILLTRHVSERTADPIQISGFSSRIGEIHGSQLKESKSAPHFLKIVRFRAFVGNPVAHALITFCSF
jgi:hypothetical protein